MLPERLTQLLTAYIDGELSSRQRKAVTRLLRKSPEARKLLQEMQQDSIVLRGLPRKKMKQDLSQTLPGTIEMRGLKLPPPPSTAAPRVTTVPVWVALIAATLLLGGIGVGSYLFFATANKKTPHTTSARAEPSTPSKQATPPGQPSTATSKKVR